MSIRAKMAFLFALIGVAVCGGIVAISLVTQNQISQMEKQECKVGAARFIRYLEAELRSVVNVSSALTLWEEYYQAVQQKDHVWIEENLASCIKEDSTIEFTLTLDLQGKIVADLNTPAVIRELAVPAFPVAEMMGGAKSCAADFVKTRSGIYLLAQVKVVRNQDANFEKPAGYTVFGRKINRRFLENCALITGVKLQLTANGQNISVAGFKNVAGSKTSSTPILIRERHGVRITCWERITDRQGRRIAEIAVQSFSNKGTTAIQSFQKGAWIVGLVIGGMIVGCIYLLKRSVIIPIRQASMMMKDIAEGDGNLAVRLELDRNDELGEMAKYFNAFVAKTRHSVKAVLESMLHLKNTSVSLAGISHTMAESSRETSVKTSAVTARAENIASGFSQMSCDLASAGQFVAQVAASVETMSGNANQLAVIAEQTAGEVKFATEQVGRIRQQIKDTAASAQDVSNSVNNVVQSVQEIKSSLSEVNQSCNQSAQITRSAKDCALETREIIGLLNQSSREIGKMVLMINDIADQTNMLALNAAIEAASAGNAGKGFAVVAHEVKELACQTGEATDQISCQIEKMKTQMDKAVEAVAAITKVIDEINTLTDAITGAVYEQSAAVNRISSSAVNSAAKVEQISGEVREIAQRAQEVTQSSEASVQSVTEIAQAVIRLSAVAVELAAGSVNAKHKIQEITQRGEALSAEAVEISQAMEQIKQSSAEVTVCAGDTDAATQELVKITEVLEHLVVQFKV